MPAMDYLLRNIDLYCERTDFSFWAEPLNAWSNLFIFAAGIIGLCITRRIADTANKSYVTSLSLIAAITGIGSFLFHTFANMWSYWSDVIPIFAFMLVYLYYACRRIYQLSSIVSFVICVCYLALSLWLDQSFLRTLLNGSVSYFPAFCVLFGTGLYLVQKKTSTGRQYLLASFVFLVSLTFRTLDNQFCSSWVYGTHFLWHTFNGLLLWALIDAAKQTLLTSKKLGN